MTEFDFNEYKVVGYVDFFAGKMQKSRLLDTLIGETISLH